METATTHKDRDNHFTVTLKRGGTALTEDEMAAITKIEIKYGGAYYNSIDNSSGFVRSDSTGQFKVKPYELGLSAGRDDVEVIVYDEGDYQHGLRWGVFKLTHSDDVTVGS